MNAALLKVQLAACGVLGAVILLEWGWAEFSNRRLEDTLNRTISTDFQSDPLPGLTQTKQTVENFANIVERPLFIEGRRPLPEEEQENTEAVADTGKLDDWELIGIYKNDKKEVALFRKQNEAKKYLKLYGQQTISGWQLEEIHNDRVVLQLGTQRKTVMLTKPREQSKLPLPARRPGLKAAAQPLAPSNNHAPEKENDR